MSEQNESHGSEVEQGNAGGGSPEGGFNKSAIAIVIAILLIGGAIFWGYRSNKKKTESVVATSTASAGSSVPARPDPVIATADGMNILESEFQAAVATLPEQMQNAVQVPAGRKRMIEELVRMKLLTREATKLGVEKKPEVKAKLTVAEGNILANAVVDELVRQNLTVSLEQLYARNTREFESVKARHIVVAYEGGLVPAKTGKPASIEAATKKAADIATQLRAGADFTALAKKESDEPNADKSGGDMGEMGHSELPEDIDKVLFALPVNTFSEPVKSRYGIHVFQVTERTTKTFAQVRQAVEQQERAFRVKDAIEEVHRKAKVDLNQEWIDQGKSVNATPPQTN